jgi:D-threo-aldose 1-dehydrogenase
VRHYDPSPEGIRRSLEESLDRLGLDRVDILYLHDPDAYDLERGLGEGLPALAALRAEGLVARIGIGVNDAAVAARAVREGELDLVMIAGRYTLLEQPALDELLPACEAAGTRVVAAAPYNSGLLSTSRPRRSATYDYAQAPDGLIERAERLAEVCESHGVDLPAVALQFPLRSPLVESVVFGTSRADGVWANIERARTPVPEALWADLVAQGLLRAEAIA